MSQVEIEGSMTDDDHTWMQYIDIRAKANQISHLCDSNEYIYDNRCVRNQKSFP